MRQKRQKKHRKRKTAKMTNCENCQHLSQDYVGRHGGMQKKLRKRIEGRAEGLPQAREETGSCCRRLQSILR